MIFRTLLLCAALIAAWALGVDMGYDKGYLAGLNAQREVIITKSGVASWYGPGFHGRRASDGSTYDQNAMTAAHRTLPFGTKVRVTNLKNGLSVLVTITDRGPYVGNRVIDMSRGSAERLGMVHDGLAKVELRVVA